MQRFNCFRGVMAGCLAVLFSAGASLQAAVPDIVLKIPANSQAALVIPKLVNLDQKLKIVNKKLEINNPQLEEAVLTMKNTLRFIKGVDDNGGMVFAISSIPIPKPPQPNLPPEPAAPPRFLIIVPVTDYNTFLGNFGPDVVQKGGVASVVITGQKWFSRKDGKFAIIGTQQEDVVAYRPGGAAWMKRAGVRGQRAVATSDVIYLVDFQKLAEQLRPMLAQSLAQMKQTFKELGEQDPNMKMAAAYFDIYGKMFDAYLRDADMLVGTVDLSAEGIGLGSIHAFKADSPLAKLFDKAPAKKLALDKVPATKPYVMAMALDTTTLPLGQWYKDMADALAEHEGMSKIMRQSGELMDKAAGQWQMAIYPKGDDWVNGVTVMTAKDPKGYVTAFQKMLQTMNGVDFGQGIGYQTTYTPNAKVVNGVAVDQYKMKLKMPEELKQQAANNPILNNLNLYNGYVFTRKDVVAQTIGGGDQTLTQTLTAIDGGASLEKDPGIASARKGLPDGRIIEGYLDPGGTAMWMENLMKKAGQVVQIPIRQNMPPISGSMSASGGAVEMRGYVAYETILGIKDMAQILENQGGVQPQPVPQPLN